MNTVNKFEGFCSKNHTVVRVAFEAITFPHFLAIMYQMKVFLDKTDFMINFFYGR